MAKSRPEEVLIQGEQGHRPILVKKRDYVLVRNSKVASVLADLPIWDFVVAKEEPLIVRKVFVQEIQAAAREAALEVNAFDSLPRLSSHACRESRTASPTA